MSTPGLDINTLKWVKSEIDETINQARQSLEAYVEAPDDDSQLRFVVNYLHQVRGTLQMVELYGAAMLAEEMEYLSQSILDGKVGNRNDAFEAMITGMLKLPDYLDHLQSGHKDMPMLLLPVLNDLRAARGESLLSENSMFTPDLTVEAPTATAVGDDAAAKVEDIRNMAKKLRHNFHLGLLAWFRDRDPKSGLKNIAKVIETLRNSANDAEANRILWTASGVVEGLQEGGVEPSVAVKMLMGQVDRQIKRIIDRGEQSLSSEPPKELVKNLLYYVASSTTNGERVKELKQAFRLKEVMPDRESLEKARADLAGPNAAIIETVSGVLLENLNQVKDLLDVFVRSEERDPQTLQPMVDMLAQMGDTLGMLSYGAERKIAQAQQEALKAMITGATTIDDDALMDIAGAMLSIESALRQPGAVKRSDQEPEEDTETLRVDQTVEKRLQAAEQRELMTSVVNEARNDLNKVKEAVSDFSLTPKNVGVLKSVPGLLDQIRGSLSILGLDRASGLLKQCTSYIKQELIEAKRIPDPASIDALADTLSSIEYYLESLTDNWGNPAAILDYAEQSLNKLGYGQPTDTGPTSAEGGAVTEDETLIDMAMPDGDTLQNLEIEGLPQGLQGDAADMADFDLSDESTSELSLADFEQLSATKTSAAQGDDDNTAEFEFSLPDDQFGESDTSSLSLAGLQLEELGDDATAEFELALPESPRSLDESLQDWFETPKDDARRRQLLEALADEAQANDKAALVVKDMQALIKRIGQGDEPLTADARSTLELARDTLMELSGAVAAPINLDSSEATEDAIVQPDIPSSPPPVTSKPAAPRVDNSSRSMTSSNTSSIIDDLDDDIIDIFMEEAQEEYENISRLLPIWQANQDEIESLKTMRRSFHTLKGSGRLVGAADVGEFAWAFENMLNRVLDNTVQPSARMFEVMAKGRDTLPILFDLFRTSGQPGPEVFALMECANKLSRGLDVELPASEPAAAVDDSLQDNTEHDDIDSVSMPGNGMDPVLLDIYEKEAATHLATLRKYAERWEAGDTSVSEPLLRALHTLTGSSRTTSVKTLATLFGEFEKYAKYLESAHLSVDEDTLELLKDVEQFAAHTLDGLRTGATPPDNSNLLTRLHHLFETVRDGMSTLELSQAQVGEAIEIAAPPELAKEDLSYDIELLEIFLEEGFDILNESDQVLRDWNADRDNREHMETLQRLLHTLKGGARMANVRSIGDLSHSIESLMTGLVEKQIEHSDKMFQVLQKCQDRLMDMLDKLKLRQAVPPADDLIRELDILLGKAAAEPVIDKRFSPDDSAVFELSVGDLVIDAPDDEISIEAPAESGLSPITPPVPRPEEKKVVPLRTKSTTGGGIAPWVQEELNPLDESDEARALREQVRVRADLLDNLVNFAGEVSIYRSRLDQQTNAFRYNLTELDETVRRLRDQLRKFEIEAEAQIQFRLEDTTAQQADFDPLEFDRFTQMQQLSRGMLESLGDLDSLRGILGNLTRESETLLLQQSRVNTELQEGLMRTRMVPFSGQLTRLRRIVRQTAEELGKDVELNVHGADTEIDRSVLERMLPPLEHMLRNAIAHGIEMPSKREASGKPAQGRIDLTLGREGGDIVIKVVDDGAGINLEAIQKKAVQRGMISADAKPGKSTLLDLIMTSGFSTAEEVTQIAGRGVGMDVVNNEIKQLGGLLNTDTEKGVGTTFTVSLPLTLSLTRALLVKVGEETYAIPLLSVEGVERISTERLRELYAQESPSYKWVNREYPFMHLGRVMGVAEPVPPEDDAQIALLMVRTGEYRAAFHVEGLIGSREIVMKPVGPQLATLRGVSGATIMGDGSVVLIVDLGVLIRLAATQAQLVESEPVQFVEVPEVRTPTIMVVDDSITVRKVTTRFLLRNNFVAVTAKDGVDALAQLQEIKPDVMLLDVEMPRMDGFELATNIRNSPELKHIPIIMITSRTGDKHRQRAAAIGVNIYMGKPYNESDLLANIQSLLEK